LIRSDAGTEKTRDLIFGLVVFIHQDRDFGAFPNDPILVGLDIVFFQLRSFSEPFLRLG